MWQRPNALVTPSSSAANSPIPIVMNPSQWKATFTADDWGMSPGVNSAIIEMAERGLIKRVSILAGGPFVKHGLDELLKIPGVQFGLHFNLTLFPPLFEEQQDAFSPFLDPSCFHYKPLWRLKLIWFTPFRKKEKLLFAVDAFKGQLEKLRSLKVPVTYFDGNQDVHLLPGLLEAVAPELSKWGLKETRLPSAFRLFNQGKFLTAWMALRSKSILRKLGLTVRPSWRPSLSDLSSTRSLRKKLSSSKKPFDVIVLPSTVNDLDGYGIRVRYQDGRVQEYQALNQLLTRS